MPKKIYDIKPPKVARKKIEKVVKEVSGKPRIRRVKKDIVENVVAEVAPNTVREVIRERKDKKSIWQPIASGVCVVLVLAGVYLFFKLPKADISVWPKIETLALEQKITATKSVNTVDEDKLIIPAKYFEVTKTKSQDFPATGSGSDEGKASGTITIYNKVDPVSSFTFKAGTRFVSDSGKLFLAQSKVVIPAAKKVNGKITPGTVTINVQAAEGGADYNIAPSHFSVPGLKGTANFYSISAVSDSDMTGGYSGNVKKVTSDDIQGAKDVLREKTEADAISALKGQVTSDYILLDNAVISSISNAVTKVKAGTIADNFNYSLSVKASALAFKKSDIDLLVKKYIDSQIPEGKTLLENGTKIDYSSSVIDISGGSAKLTLNISAGYYQDIDKNSLGLLLLNQNENQIKEKINNTLGDQVSKTEVEFWPFWVKSTPGNQKSVNLHINLE